MEFPTRFDFREAEPRLYRLWEPHLRASEGSAKRPFVIVIPPPNVTGSLHMGHALNNTLQDILIRYHRMNGDEALYLPGTDHAGIATQFVVEKELAREKKTRFDLGRDGLVRRVWEWKEKYGNTILMQLRRLGCSCDWSRTSFTMDPGYSRAVRVAFVSLFRKGLIYRGQRLVNWCPRCKTALSDLEVQQRKEPGKLWHLKYPVKGEPGRFVTVATTRPETMLGDTAVAVNPADARYRNLVGKTIVLPIVQREIPVIADEFVSMDFGTGVVKITPAHDFADFEVAERHKLPRVQVIDADGKMTAEAGKYRGMDRFEARRKIVEEPDLVEKTEDYEVALGRCYRCDTILEPYLSLQWFVAMKPLVPPAIRAVEDEEIRFHPRRFQQTYLDWLYNIKDWCISRQIWWGHRIPVWYCDDCGAATSSVEDPSECARCRSGRLRQDEDVLDTWFSSALWPFATLGWPDETEDLEKFYPTSVLVTGRDIINLWVARMIITGYEFCGDKPFTDVVINPTIQTMTRKRMSKSLGTGLDPLILMDHYGADALRWCLTVKTTGMQDVPMGLPAELAGKVDYKGGTDDSILEARNFVTKVWNASRFVILNCAGAPEGLPDKAGLAIDDRWILSRLATTTERYTEALDRYEFGEAARLLYHFVWDEFCDYYIELSKRRIEQTPTKQVLLYCVDRILRLLHPICPFVTEEIWQKFRSGTLMTAEWPEPMDGWVDPPLEQSMEDVMEAVRAVRLVRNKMKLSRHVPLSAVIDAKRKDVADFLQQSRDMIMHLAPAEDVRIAVGITRPAHSSPVVTPNFTVFVPLEGKVNVPQELARLRAQKESLDRQISSVEAKLNNPGFRAKARPEVIEDEEDRLAELKSQAAALTREISDLEALR